MKRTVPFAIIVAGSTLFACSPDPGAGQNNIIIDSPSDFGTPNADAGDGGESADGGIVDGGDMSEADSCVPESDEDFCLRFEFECGPLTEVDNCGEERTVESCGDGAVVCENFTSCGGGGSPGQCGCTPATCAGLGVLCGEVDDTCGGTLDCDLFCVDSITAGGEHGCAIGSGNVKCWGSGGAGRLGTGETSTERNPADVDWGMSNVQVLSASAGGSHTCIVDAAGRVVCWGSNGRSQLGIGTTVDTSAPGAAAVMTGADEVSSGLEHACALSMNGRVTCWGSNDFGQIGDPQLNLEVNIGVPTQPAGLDSGVTAISTGWNHSCVIQDEGNLQGVVKCWGRNRYAQTSPFVTNYVDADTGISGYLYDRAEDWDLQTLRAAPTRIDDPENPGNPWTGIQQVATGGTHTCVLDSQSRVWCWGTMPGFDPTNSCPKVDGKTASLCSVFPRDEGIFIGSGSFPAMGEVSVGSVQAVWVANTPTLVDVGGKTPTSIAAGEDHHCMIISDPDAGASNIMCFGRNGFGQIGDGTTNNWTAARTVFLDVADNPVVATQIELGNRHSCALVSDSNVKCWGSNATGQIGNSSLQRDETYRPYDVKLEAE